MATADVQQPADAGAVQLKDLQFSYPGCGKFLKGVSLDLPRGSRTLLLGANGAGKTTLLQLIAGKYMVGRDTIRVLQHSPFYDMVSQEGSQPGDARHQPHTPAALCLLSCACTVRAHSTGRLGRKGCCMQLQHNQSGVLALCPTCCLARM